MNNYHRTERRLSSDSEVLTHSGAPSEHSQQQYLGSRGWSAVCSSSPPCRHKKYNQIVKSVLPNLRNSLRLHLLYSDTSFMRSSTEILLLSCLKSGEKRDSRSNAPWLSLKTDL